VFQVREVLRVHKILVVGYLLRPRLRKDSQYGLREQLDFAGVVSFFESCLIEFVKSYQLVAEIIRIEIQLNLILQQLVQLRSPYGTVGIKIFESCFKQVIRQLYTVVVGVS